jgi:1-acyl-sn-glycerol-3-phosphate acyltransferase
MNIAELWIGCNNFMLRAARVAPFDTSVLPELSYNRWYLVLSNHQSWSDIFILQYVFNRRIPMLKFFIKQILIYVPVIGIAWWVLDFPIMKRYSREQIEAKPELAGKDLETTRQSCERFQLTPVSILNFLEGTRFSEQKKQERQSPFKRLLRPKVGGAALVLDTLGTQIDAVIDVTIIYPQGAPTLMQFLAGDAGSIRVIVDSMPVPRHLPLDRYEDSGEAREEIQDWFNAVWRRKDERLAMLK